VKAVDKYQKKPRRNQNKKEEKGKTFKSLLSPVRNSHTSNP